MLLPTSSVRHNTNRPIHSNRPVAYIERERIGFSVAVGLTEQIERVTFADMAKSYTRIPLDVKPETPSRSIAPSSFTLKPASARAAPPSSFQAVREKLARLTPKKQTRAESGRRPPAVTRPAPFPLGVLPASVGGSPITIGISMSLVLYSGQVIWCAPNLKTALCQWIKSARRDEKNA